MDPRERGIVPEREKLSVVETIGNTKRVRILSDGTWEVGWQQPPTQPQSEGKVVWHRHEDVWRVLRQNTRVIDRFLGVPILDSENDEEVQDPNIGASLTQLQRRVFIPGENAEARALAERIENVIALSTHRSLSAENSKKALADIARRVERVRNLLKVEARDQLANVSAATGEPTVSQVAFAAHDAFLKRAQEGASIVRSLFDRGSDLLEWVNTQEIPISRLRFALGQAITDFNSGKMDTKRWEDYANALYGGHRLLDDIETIKGRPYSQLAEKREIVRLKNERLIRSRDTDQVKEIIENAYIPLEQIWQDKEARRKSEQYAMYEKKKKR